MTGYRGGDAAQHPEKKWWIKKHNNVNSYLLGSLSKAV